MIHKETLIWAKELFQMGIQDSLPKSDEPSKNDHQIHRSCSFGSNQFLGTKPTGRALSDIMAPVELEAGRTPLLARSRFSKHHHFYQKFCTEQETKRKYTVDHMVPRPSSSSMSSPSSKSLRNRAWSCCLFLLSQNM